MGFVFFSRRVHAKRGLSRPPHVPGGVGGGGWGKGRVRGAHSAPGLRLPPRLCPPPLPPQAALRLVDFSIALAAVPGAAGRGFRTHLFLAGSQEESKSSSPRVGVKKHQNFVGLISRAEGGSRSKTEQLREGASRINYDSETQMR